MRREPSIDFQTALAANLANMGEREVLSLAAREGRILVTQDRKTMPKHFADFINAETSPGVLIIPQKLAVSFAVEELTLIWSASEADEWINKIRSLPL